MRRINAVVIGFASVFVMVAGSGRADMGAQQACADQSSFVVAAAEKEQAPSGEVQERAVPRTGAPGSLAPKMEGLIMEGNQVKAMPGYVLEKGPNNQVTARRAGGGSGGLGITTVMCVCKSIELGGTCTTDVIGGEAKCYKGSGNCSGTCAWRIITTGSKDIRPQ